MNIKIVKKLFFIAGILIFFYLFLSAKFIPSVNAGCTLPDTCAGTTVVDVKDGCTYVPGPTDAYGNPTVAYCTQKYYYMQEVTCNGDCFYTCGTSKKCCDSFCNLTDCQICVGGSCCVNSGVTPTSGPGPTDTPPVPTATPTPLPCPSGFNVSCASSGTQATISWNALSGASGYVLRVNKFPYDDWASAEDMFLQPTDPSQTINTTPNVNYTYDVQGKKPGEAYPYSGARCPFSEFNCPAPTPTPTPIPPPVISCSAIPSGINWSWNNLAGTISYWLQVWSDFWKVNDWGYTSPTFTTGTPGVTYYGRVKAGDGTQTSPWSNTASCTVPAPSTPNGACGSFNTTTATTPVTWTWDYGTGLQCKNNHFDLGGDWWYNTDAISPLTIHHNINNTGSTPGVRPGTLVCARTTYDFSNFSSEKCITCDMPDNQQSVISGVLRQKSGTGCYQADASNNFNIINLSGTTGDDCVTASCTASPGNSNAIAYSCIVTWDNQACVAQGRQPDTTQTLTLTAAATSVDAGQFSDASCGLEGTQLPITAGNDQIKDITFPVANENWVKLDNASFNATSTTNNNIPPFINKFTPSDPNDDALQKYLIMNSALSTAGVALNVTSNSYSLPDWHDSSYGGTSIIDPAAFLNYVKSRKEYTKITALDQIVADGIYVWDDSVNFDPITDSTIIPDKNFILISTVKTITIQRQFFEPSKSVAIVATNITFGDTTERAKGIFIGQTVKAGTNSDLGLKITGNLIAQTFNNNRSWSDTSRPSIFVVFDPNQYINLLPYLSNANYEWRQIQ